MAGQGRKRKTGEDYHREGKSVAGEDWKERDWQELVSLACDYVAKGFPPARIPEMLKADYQIAIRRERAWHLVSYAAVHRWLKYTPPTQPTLESELKRRYPWLREVVTVHTGAFEGVAYRGAELLVRILQGAAGTGKAELHLGFAGGSSMARTARELSEQLKDPAHGRLPRKIVLHTMVAGFNDDPTVDPASFCSFFAGDPAILVDFEYAVLRAPSIVTPEEYARLRAQQQIHECFERARALDVIVTSCALWQDPHSILRTFMAKRSPESFRRLEEAGCVGDMLSRPLGPRGPLPDDGLEIRALTLMELDDLRAFIDAGKRVVLVSSPCSICGGSKTATLRVILDCALISDLVVDSRTARQLLMGAP
jgi:DNA-binding transcriptional regulator LsrR (DeoR family)